MLKIFIITILLQCFLLCDVFAVETLRCIVLDVGEGQSVLLGRGEKGVLVDTGHFGRSFQTIKSIRDHGVTQIDTVILTHLHSDHSSGLFTIMNEFPEATLYESGHRIEFDPVMDSYRWVVEAIDADYWPVKTLRQGDAISWEGVRMKVLWPVEPEGSNLNSHSLVLAIEYGSNIILIMGDTSKEIESLLLAQGLIPENINVLIVGHHGAADATGSDLLGVTRPENSVISINNNNVRGYPDKNVIKELEKIGSKVHTTFEDGDVAFTFEK